MKHEKNQDQSRMNTRYLRYVYSPGRGNKTPQQMLSVSSKLSYQKSYSTVTPYYFLIIGILKWDGREIMN